MNQIQYSSLLEELFNDKIASDFFEDPAVLSEIKNLIKYHRYAFGMDSWWHMGDTDKRNVFSNKKKAPRQNPSSGYTVYSSSSYNISSGNK